MLQGISKLLTGDLLKALCDMGHGDELVIADANFPGESVARRLIRCPGISGTDLLRAIAPLIPLDAYSPAPALVMQLTDSDRAKGMPDPAIWGEYEAILRQNYGADTRVNTIERYAFYERAKAAYLVIQTGEERIYGNLLLAKGVIA